MTRYALWMVFAVLTATTGCAAQPGATPKPPPTGVVGCGCGEDALANIGDRVFYGFNSAELSNDAVATLGRQSAWLDKYPSVNVLVAGNADERGTEAYNLALGQRRANAARDDLVAQGVAASRIRMISYGKDCPVTTGNDEVSYQQNRTAITSVQGANPQNCR